jgi:UDP-N-acetylglucosamine 4,6-dehydratase|tara:strand:+ start:7 stop:996 length:990 start_codon:yes stop_codon:yes gene_type:complete
MFEGKKILITGGTGSLGQALTERLLKLDVDSIRIFSRNESKQVEMESKFENEKLRFLIGDIRDLPRLERALEDIDIVFHAAALKHVPLIEYNPFEGIKTNIIGTQNLIDASIKQNVERVIGIGTDKAVSPLNAYGATKQLMEKLFITSNNFLNPAKHRTKFISLRYGNVLSSSNSIVPKFIALSKLKKELKITDPEMTRFSITMNEALDFILDSAKHGTGSEIFIPKLRAYSVMDVKNAISDLYGDTGFTITGIRPGEKMHETLIGDDEMRYAWDLTDKYVLFSPFMDTNKIKENYSGIKEITKLKKYSSDMVQRIPHDELKNRILETE